MSALISGCGTYRYRLTRDLVDGGLLPEGRQTVTFVMLNPSTADATQDDPTIRRCRGFARALGAGTLVVVNLYALRSTDPKELWRHPDPVGPDNDAHLTAVLERAAVMDELVIAAWGANARQDRVAAFLALPRADRVSALGMTKAGAPSHPLYLRASARPTPWPVSG